MLFVFAALALVAGARSAPVAAPKPHLLFALIDDWGWFDKCACPRLVPLSAVLGARPHCSVRAAASTATR